MTLDFINNFNSPFADGPLKFVCILHSTLTNSAFQWKPANVDTSRLISYIFSSQNSPTNQNLFLDFSLALVGVLPIPVSQGGGRNSQV